MGDIGPEARRFADWLRSAGVGIWQVLPLCPPGGPHLNVPYASWSALAANPQLISLDDLREAGLLDAADLEPTPFPAGEVDFARVLPWRTERLVRAADRLLADHGHPLAGPLDQFRARAGWAEETALFAALRMRSGLPWWRWPARLRDRDPAALEEARADLGPELARGVALQFLFEHQWAALRRHCREQGIAILDDLPIYVMHESADVWAHPEAFRLAPGGALLATGGAPPDEFSAAGQNWSCPIYDWDRMAEDDYAWWRARLARALEHSDAVRIDHFRAFSAFWEIPAGARAPAQGRWVPGPGLRFFEVLRRRLGPLPLCVEDLGGMDADALALREATGFPGMRMLHYAFGAGPENPHLPHNDPVNCIAYTGNHDNDTTAGWWGALPPGVRSEVQHYLGRSGEDIAWDLIRAALGSVARTAVVPMQDVLALGSAARMNEPGSYTRPPEQWRNWGWRMLPGAASPFLAERLRLLNSLYGRTPLERR